MIKCDAMKNTAILLHKKRDDIREFINEFPNTYIYLDTEMDFDSRFIVKIQHSSLNNKNIIGDGIRHIHRDLPDCNIVIVNESVSVNDVKNIIEELEDDDAVIIATNDDAQLISKKTMLGAKFITRLFNIVHKQQAKNIMSNVQGIPADKVHHFLKLKGDVCNALISERFIIKDHNIDYRYINLNSNVFSDAPNSFLGYFRCALIICFIFIKFMLSSVSAFLLDYSLSLLGYNFWSPMIVAFFSNLSAVPHFLLDVEIVSTGIARSISSIYNYSINKRVVFAARGNVTKLVTACKYFALVLIIWVFNTIILKLATTYLNIPFAIAKIIADIIMYFVSFSVQRDMIFKKRNK